MELNTIEQKFVCLLIFLKSYQEKKRKQQEDFENSKKEISSLHEKEKEEILNENEKRKREKELTRKELIEKKENEIKNAFELDLKKYLKIKNYCYYYY